MGSFRAFHSKRLQIWSCWDNSVLRTLYSRRLSKPSHVEHGLGKTSSPESDSCAVSSTRDCSGFEKEGERTDFHSETEVENGETEYVNKLQKALLEAYRESPSQLQASAVALHEAVPPPLADLAQRINKADAIQQHVTRFS